MKKSRYTEEQIVGVLKESEAGLDTAELCRKHGISQQTFYRWKAKYGGLEVSDAQRLRQLEEENRKLKQLVAEQALDIVGFKPLRASHFSTPPTTATGSLHCPLRYTNYLPGTNHRASQMQSTLGHLYESPQQGANLTLYGCKDGSTDYFVSTDSACEGQQVLGTEGYGYSQPVAGLTLVALYSCYTGHDHFVSQDPKCEGQGTGQLLGYALP